MENYMRKLLLAVVLMVPMAANAFWVDSWSVVKNGECYSYKMRSIVALECYASYEEAKRHMEVVKAFSESRRLHEEKKWEAVDE